MQNQLTRCFYPSGPTCRKQREECLRLWAPTSIRTTSQADNVPDWTILDDVRLTSRPPSPPVSNRCSCLASLSHRKWEENAPTLRLPALLENRPPKQQKSKTEQLRRKNKAQRSGPLNVSFLPCIMRTREPPRAAKSQYSLVNPQYRLISSRSMALFLGL